jgi:hypothetical protein
MKSSAVKSSKQPRQEVSDAKNESLRSKEEARLSREMAKKAAADETKRSKEAKAEVTSVLFVLSFAALANVASQESKLQKDEAKAEKKRLDDERKAAEKVI